MKKIAQWRDVDPGLFHNEIVVGNAPAVMRSFAADWPAVRACQASPSATCEYLGKFGGNAPVYTIAAPPDAGGRFFYSDDFTGVNFRRGQIPLNQVLGQLLSSDGDDNAHAIAVQALSINESMPGFAAENTVDVLDESIAPTMWIGNRGKVAPHYDVHRNLACVVSGRRHFVLFPPEQIANLYLGPVLNAPGGVPVSIVDPWQPDINRFPRFAEALDAAEEAILEPGDAIFIPALWWHGVASLEAVNVLVNYWWDGIGGCGVSPNDSLLHAMMTMADLDSAGREAWRAYFDYLVFHRGGMPDAHLPDGLHDIISTLSDEQAETLKQLLARRLLPD